MGEMKKSKRYFNNLLLLVGLLAVQACGPTIVFEQSIAIDQTEWNYDQNLIFEFEAPDTSNLYNILLIVDHSMDYEYQNLYVNINTTFPGGNTDQQMISLNLADKMGNWNGVCSGSKCEATIGLQLNAKFEKFGKYKIEIVQNTRKEFLPHLSSFTLAIEEVESSSSSS